jgi:Ca2+-binding EF-hand superfamily protein
MCNRRENMKMWKVGLVTAGLGWGMLAGAAVAQQAGAQPGQTEPAKASNLPTPMGALRDLQGLGQVLFKLADSNNDGQISQKEAIDVANTAVGGFFFRADANGDGVISPEEARQARDELFQKRPWLRFVVQRTQSAQGGEGSNADAQQNPLRNLASLIDTNQDKQIQATEVRQAVQNTVQTLFAAADTNHDGQLSPSEVNAAVVGMERMAEQAVFQAADKDHNGQLSQDEFLQMLAKPARSAFAILDANGDGQLTPQEIESAERVIITQLRALKVPEQPNSPAHLIESGLRPSQVAPVPNIPIPGTAAQPGRTDQAVQPASVTTPAPTPAPSTVPR